jgi:hypothetical protein
VFSHICWGGALLCLLLLSGCSQDKDAQATRDMGVADAAPDVTTAPDVEEDASPDAEDMASPDAADVEPPQDMEPDGPYDPGPPPEAVREAAPAARGPLRAGAAIGYLDGPVGISMAGYGGRTNGPKSIWSQTFKGSRGFYGHMTTKAMVLEVEQERLVLIKLPTMSSEDSLTDAITAKLLQDHGLDLEGRILTGATHSHHAHARYWRLPPSLGIIGIDVFDEEVLDRMATVFAATIAQAVEDLGPAQWAYGAVEGWDSDNRVYRDRRANQYPKDPRLSLLAVRRPDGTPMATVINFGMHGTVFGDRNDLLTEDSAGGLEMKFEDYFYAQQERPILGMFMQAGGGDASPAGDHLGHPSPARVELIGATAAPRIYEVYQGLEFKEEASLAVRSRRIGLRYSWMGYDDFPEFLNEDGDPYLWGGWQCTVDNPELSMQGQPKNCVPMDTLLESFGETVPYREVHQTFLTVARLDDLFLVTLPGEPAYSTIKYLRDQVQGLSTQERPLQVMGVGYSQDHLLYLTHPDDWFEGDYESQMGMWGPLLGKFLVDKQVQTVRDMVEGFHKPLFYEETSTAAEPQPFTPRQVERSLDPGQLLATLEASYARTQSVTLDFNGGDPALGSPQAVLQRQVSPGTFEDVPATHGLAGAVYDNSRYQMLTLYRPEPAMSARVLEQRRHGWRVVWEIPLGFPAGQYRFVMRGQHWDGQQAASYEVETSPFAITHADSDTLDLERQGERLLLRWTGAPVPFSWSEEGRWPVQGWRLQDPRVGPEQRPQILAPLRVQLLANGEPVGDPVDVLFSPEDSAHSLDLTGVALPQDAALGVRAWVAADAEPSALEAALP